MTPVITRPLGNVASFPVAERTLERIPLDSDALAKRVLRFSTSRGDLGLRLSGDERLVDGDVVFADDAVVIAVAVVPDDVLVCRPVTVGDALRLAHALGNRHLPVQIDGDVLVARYDRLVEDVASECGVPCAREARTVPAPFRYAHAPHGHGAA